MLTFPGFGSKRPAAMIAPPPPPPNTMLEPEIKKAKQALEKQRGDRAATILTGAGGLLGDPPLDRPMARSATVMGG